MTYPKHRDECCEISICPIFFSCRATLGCGIFMLCVLFTFLSVLFQTELLRTLQLVFLRENKYLCMRKQPAFLRWQPFLLVFDRRIPFNLSNLWNRAKWLNAIQNIPCKSN